MLIDQERRDIQKVTHLLTSPRKQHFSATIRAIDVIVHGYQSTYEGCLISTRVRQENAYFTFLNLFLNIVSFQLDTFSKIGLCCGDDFLV